MGYTPHVVVVGGGVLGTALARDFAIRGLDVTLLEQGTLTSGTTGRNQGVLYSGARFALSDPTGAKRCLREGRVLRSIASHCLDETAGIIATPPGRSESFEELVAACDSVGISYQELTGEEIADSDLDSDIQRAIRVPDGAVDPFRLTLCTAESARNYGATIKTGTKVCDLTIEDGRVAGLTVEFDPDSGTALPPLEPADPGGRADDADAEEGGDDADVEEGGADDVDAEEGGADADVDDSGDDESEDSAELSTDSGDKEMPGEIQREFPGVSDDGPERGETEEIDADFVVNATGPWADRIAALAGIDLPLSRTRGRMFVLESPPERIVTRQDTEPPLSLSPFWGNAVLGPVPVAQPLDAAFEEIAAILSGSKEPTVLRSYTGVWAQHASHSGDPYGPGATVIDHHEYDDCWGMMSVLGGTITTHRAIAKHVVDRVCSEFGIDRDCLTAEIDLPELSQFQESASSIMKPTTAAMGTLTGSDDQPDPVLCETRSVRQSVVQEAIESEDARGTDLTDVRIRTGATMGRCQGGRCGHRIAAQLYPEADPDVVAESLETLLSTRWQGRKRTLWGDQLTAAIEDYQFHAVTLDRASEQTEELDWAEFDDGRTTEGRERPTCCEAVIP